jgi:hypothetical protein
MIAKSSKIIFEHLCQNEFNLNITLEKTEPIPIDYEFLKYCINDTKERLKIKLSKGGIYSELLIEQISLHRANYGERFGDKIEYFNASEILDLIEKIEHKKIIGTAFSDKPLKGYLHIHHNTYSSLGYSIVRNIKEFWFNRHGEIKNDRIKDFEEIIKKYETQKFSEIAIEMHQKAMTKKELKGEWLIYKVIDGINYYLCLASHREGINRTESDENIFNSKIAKCIIEFPELK